MAGRGGNGGNDLKAPPRVSGPRKPHGFETLVTTLGGGTLDFSAMLAIADILPVMVAYLDTSLIYRFVNKPLADWLGSSRRKILGRPVEEIIGVEAFGQREALYQVALGGERTFYASEFEHPTRGHVAVESDYVPWADKHGVVRGIIVLFEDVTEQRSAEQ
ncbi:MAG TPA: PAS domain-containing protein, partial [Sphingomicrobium sp.]|nr:PAS domain-containing protein [Sphingomicrobium sp.]